jgi:hypothetical protein
MADGAGASGTAAERRTTPVELLWDRWSIRQIPAPIWRLVIGAPLGGAPRTVLWIVAVAIDYARPAWLTRERLRGLQRVAVAHFAERYGLFVIICLGESIVAIGLAANGHHVGAELIAADPQDDPELPAVHRDDLALWMNQHTELASGAATPA